MNTHRMWSLCGISAAVLLVAATLFLPAGAASPVASSCATTHEVQSGQTAANIASSYGVSVSQLKAVNKLANANLIYIGQKLCIPAAGSAAASSPSSKPASGAICVSGNVVDKSHEGLPGLQVVAEMDQQAALKTETDEDGNFTFENLAPGKWTFRVIVPDSWEAVTPSEFPVELSYGYIGCYQVRFKLQPLGCVIVKKSDGNGNPVPDWPISISGLVDPEDVTNENGVIRFGGLVPGTYVVQEKVLYPWTALTPDSVTVEVHPALDDEDCALVEFVNQRQDTSCIIGQKVDDQHRGVEGWTIHARAAEGYEMEPQVTDGQGSFIFKDLALGRWTLWEEVQDGWTPVTPAEFDVVLTEKSEPPECVEVRFKNRPPDLCAEGYKVDENGDGLANWMVVAYAAADPALKLKITTDSKGHFRFNGLTLGDWVFQEEHMVGWEPINSDVVKVPITAGVQCVQVPVFRNQSPRGCVEGYKRDNQEVGLPGWDVSLQHVDDGEPQHVITDGTGYFRFDDLPVGTYNVWEEMQSGWVPLIPTKHVVEVVPNDEYVCERVDFMNQQVPRDICIDGYKLDKAGNVGLPGFLVSATNVATGETLDATTDGLGYFRFGGLAPGKYEIAVGEQDGWVPVGPTTQTVAVDWPPQYTCTTVKFYNQQEGVKPPPPPPPPPPPHDGACGADHVVKSGQTLAGIAHHYGASMHAIMSANHIKNANVIYVGQKLCIPDK